MVIATNVKTEKNQYGTIIGYHLRDDIGNIVFFTSNQVKRGVYNGTLLVTNLTLSSDNRLVPSNKKAKPHRKLFGEFKPKDYVKKYGVLSNVPVELQTEEICAAFILEYAENLRHVKNQTERLCILAVGRNPSTLVYVRKQTLKIVLTALRKVVDLENEHYYYRHTYINKVWMYVYPQFYEDVKKIYNTWSDIPRPQTDTYEQYVSKLTQHRKDYMPIDDDPDEPVDIDDYY